MDLIYIEYQFKVKPLQPATEILIAELGMAGFESFVENQDGVTAYIQKQDWHKSILDDIHILKSKEFTIDFFKTEIEQTNWNQEWEKNFNPIEVDGKVSIRAPFHPNPNLDFDIIIEPKMSFGTGHHETTHMMIQQMLSLDFINKSVLDMGCGTGILAIFSEMKGAIAIDAIDIDDWCYLNSIENVERNQCKKITVIQGDVQLIENKFYDIIIANINRNVLLEDMEAYTQSLNANGILLLSGFYTEDIAVLDEKVLAYNLKLVNTITRNNWVSLCYTK